MSTAYIAPLPTPPKGKNPTADIAIARADRQSRKRPCSLESTEQQALFEWAAMCVKRYPELVLLYHIPNGGKRSIATAKRLKAEGVKAGVPDICLPVARGGFHGLYVEMKAGKNCTTQKQDTWLDALAAQGYMTAVCYGWKAASEVITGYLEAGK